MPTHKTGRAAPSPDAESAVQGEVAPSFGDNSQQAELLNTPLDRMDPGMKQLYYRTLTALKAFQRGGDWEADPWFWSDWLPDHPWLKVIPVVAGAMVDRFFPPGIEYEVQTGSSLKFAVGAKGSVAVRIGRAGEGQWTATFDGIAQLPAGIGIGGQIGDMVSLGAGAEWAVGTHYTATVQAALAPHRVLSALFEERSLSGDLLLTFLQGTLTEFQGALVYSGEASATGFLHSVEVPAFGVVRDQCHDLLNLGGDVMHASSAMSWGLTGSQGPEGFSSALVVEWAGDGGMGMGDMQVDLPAPLHERLESAGVDVATLRKGIQALLEAGRSVRLEVGADGAFHAETRQSARVGECVEHTTQTFTTAESLVQAKLGRSASVPERRTFQVPLPEDQVLDYVRRNLNQDGLDDRGGLLVSRHGLAVQTTLTNDTGLPSSVIAEILLGRRAPPVGVSMERIDVETRVVGTAMLSVGLGVRDDVDAGFDATLSPSGNAASRTGDSSAGALSLRGAGTLGVVVDQEYKGDLTSLPLSERMWSS